MAKCQFTTDYNNLETGRPDIFQCEEETSIGKFCFFHDEYYLKNRSNVPDVFFNRLKQKIEESTSQKKALLCIGYHIPDIRIENRNFIASIYFTKSTFYGKTVFNNTFFQNADFSDAEFQELTFNSGNFFKDAYFIRTKFHKKAFFSLIRFEDIVRFTDADFTNVDFIRTDFMKEAGFDYARFRKGYFAKTNFFGEADFNSAVFYSITFSKETTIHQTGDFSESIFHGKTTFSRVIFEGWTKFQNALFEEQEKTVFDVDKLSKVSFMNTDITRVRFTERVNWTEGQEPKIVDEILLEHSVFPLFNWESVPGNKKQESKLRNFLGNTFGLNWIKNNIKLIKSPDGDTINITSNDKNIVTLELKRLELKRNYGIVRVKHNDVALPAFVIKNEKNIIRGNTLRVYSVSEIRVGSVQSIYRNLRENYEYRMRYDEAGKFFIREMELKRKFREVSSPDAPYELKYNNWFRRQFSLTGLYYNLSRYGESVFWPTLSGIVIVSLSTLYWSMQANPTSEPSFIGLKLVQNQTHIWKALERSVADFLPILPLGSKEVVMQDHLIKVIGGALSFGLLAIALRRRFERKFRH